MAVFTNHVILTVYNTCRHLPTRENIQVHISCKAPICTWLRTAYSCYRTSRFQEEHALHDTSWENLGEGLRTFSGMCTLSNCIFQSVSLKCCLWGFVPWLNLKNNCHGCILIYTTGNDNIFIFLIAATAHDLLLPIITYYNLFLTDINYD